MSTYYKYQFTSPEPIFALVKEELKSYFDTGAIDDVLFPVYTEKCLKKLGKGSYKIEPVVLSVDNYSAKLPSGFKAAREVWMCSGNTSSYQAPNARYQQITSTSLKLDNHNEDDSCTLDCTYPDLIQAVYKTTNEVMYSYNKLYLLKPGNVSVLNNCSLDCANIGSSGPEAFDIRDNKIHVTFQTGTLYMLYYAEELDENGYQFVPDNYEIMEYIEAFLKYKMFEQLYNSLGDESARQIENKLVRYERAADEKFIIALTQMKKETVYQKQEAIKRTNHRNSRYHIK